MERRLAAILLADVGGYSRLMGEDEAATLSALNAHRQDLIEPKALQYRGRVVKWMGDGLLMEFVSVVEAVRFAIDVQGHMRTRQASSAEGDTPRIDAEWAAHEIRASANLANRNRVLNWYGMGRTCRSNTVCYLASATPTIRTSRRSLGGQPKRMACPSTVIPPTWTRCRATCGSCLRRQGRARNPKACRTPDRDGSMSA